MAQKANDHDPQSAISAVQEFLAAQTWSDSRQVLEQHPELLTDESDDILERLAHALEEPHARRFVEQRRALLRRCREVGIARSFGEKTGAGSAAVEMPVEIEALVRRAERADSTYSQNSDLRVLDIAVGAWQEILDYREFEQLQANLRAGVLNNGGGTYLRRYRVAGRMGDLDKAIDCFERALELTPADSPDLPMYLNNVGIGVGDRYARTSELADLNRAIDCYERVRELTPPDSPDLPGRLNSLGIGLGDRYARTGELTDLNRAIDYYERARELNPADSPDLPGRLNSLGIGLRDRYARTGELADLNRAIDCYERALDLTPGDSPDLPGRFNNLGIGLGDRYARTGELTDLNRAIDCYERARQLNPADSPDLPRHFNNLGIGLRNRYVRMGELTDLNRAINCFERARELTLPDSPDLPAILNNLGNGLRNRYARTDELADLNRAIDCYERARELTPPDSPDLPGRLNNLGVGLHDRYARTGELADLNRAIDCLERARELTPPDSPDLPGRLNNLGNGLRDRYARTGALADLKRAIGAYRQACAQGSDRALQESLRAARNWGASALERSAWQEGVEAYGFGMRAIAALVRVQLGRAGKESWLREAQGVPSHAAYCLARAGDSTAAVVAMEQGRAYLLTEALERNRADLVALQQSHSTVQQQYREAAEGVAMLEAQEALGQNRPQPETPPPGFDYAAEARVARAKLDAAVEAIRQVPGYASFLQPPTFEDIQKAVEAIADGGGLVYLATIEQGSVALIVHANDEEPVKAVWLNLTEAELVSLLVRRRGEEVVGGLLPAQLGLGGLPLELIEILTKVSDGLVAPLAAQLREIGLTQVVLIPSGRLNLLPLHAASYQMDGVTCYFGDEFTVSYAPNARALLAARRELSKREGATSLVGLGNPLPHPKPLLAAEAELEEIAELFARRFGATNPTALLREKATRAALLKDLPEAGYVHLACHASFDANAPLESALELANREPLKLREILYGAAKPLHARLVSLSACQTGITDFSRLADEYIGLPAGFLQAGVPGVVGTLWPVADLSTALLMIKFYELLLFGDEFKGKRPLIPAEALAGAQRWLRELTNRELLEYFAGQQPGGARRIAQQPDTPRTPLYKWIKGLLPRRIAQQSDAPRTRFPVQLVTEKLQELGKSGPDRRPYSHPYYWAPFIFVGV